MRRRLGTGLGVAFGGFGGLFGLLVGGSLHLGFGRQLVEPLLLLRSEQGRDLAVALGFEGVRLGTERVDLVIILVLNFVYLFALKSVDDVAIERREISFGLGASFLAGVADFSAGAFSSAKPVERLPPIMPSTHTVTIHTRQRGSSW